MILLSVVALAAANPACAQEAANHREISRLLETARLSPDGKALVRHKAVEATRAGVAEVDVAGVIRRGLDGGLQAPDLVRLLDVVAQAKRQDLPVGPVLDKVQEGLAKRVPPDRIASVASHIAENLAASRELIRHAERDGVRVERASQRERTIETIAEALGRGVTASQIEELARRVARSPRPDATLAHLHVAAQATADLVAMGLSPRDASETAAAAVAKGLSQQDIEKLRERLAHELRRGRSPEDGAKSLREEIQSNRPDRDHERATRPDKDRLDRGPDGDRRPSRR